MGKAFEAAIRRRWPGFALNKSFEILGKMPGEIFLTWRPCDGLELVFSIHPNPKPYWSSFAMKLTWSRTGNFYFYPSRGTLRAGPPEYDLRGGLRRGLTMEKADISMDVLWRADWSDKQNRGKQTFKSFDDKYNHPYFPLKSPLATFDPNTQGPEDYQRLEAAKKGHDAAGCRGHGHARDRRNLRSHCRAYLAIRGGRVDSLCVQHAVHRSAIG